MRQGQTLAGFPLRLAGLFYDVFISGSVVLIAGFAYLPITGGEAPMPGTWAGAGFQLFILAVLYLFYVGFWTHGGRTLGMLAWSLRLIDPDGNRPGLKRASLRFAACLLSWATLGLGFAWALIDPHNRALHDRLAGTWLVREHGAGGA